MLSSIQRLDWFRGTRQFMSSFASRAIFHPYALFLIVTLAVYLPDGFNIGDINDGWIELGYVIKVDALLKGGLARMFGGLPMWLGLHIDPFDFRGLQIFMLLFTVIRGSLVYEIVNRMTPQARLFSVAAGLIACFHPADRGFFWVGAIGLFFVFDVALAACLCAIVYLENRSWTCLLATVVLQLVAGLSYPGYIPLMLAIPAGALVLSHMRGSRASLVSLASVNIGLVLSVCVALLVLHKGTGRDSKVADFNLHSALLGYQWAVATLATSWSALLQALNAWYILPASLAAAFTLQVAVFLGRPAIQPIAGQRYAWIPLVMVGVGLLGLGLLPQSPGPISSKNGISWTTIAIDAVALFCSIVLLLSAAYFFKINSRDAAPAPEMKRRLILTTVSGLLGLAVISYFPYAVSTVRFLPDRTLLAAGVFGYGALLLVVFSLLARYLSWHAGVIAVSVLAGIVVLSGLKTRDYWVTQYRLQEGLLSALAETVPRPAPGTFILVHLQTPYDERRLQGFTYREEAFSDALDFMYGDVTLQGGFYGFGDNIVEFSDQGMLTRRMKAPYLGNKLIAYDKLIVVDYDFQHKVANVVGRDLLVHTTQLGGASIGYVPPTLEATPSEASLSCSMLEPAYRPSYCDATAPL